MSIRLWRHIALTFITYVSCMLPAVAQFPSWETFIEQLHAEYEESDQEMFESIYEDYAFLHANPININSADSAELKALGFLTDWQIEGIHYYIHRYGALRSIGELMLIPELDYRTRQLLSYFIDFGPLKQEEEKWHKEWRRMLTQGRSEPIGIIPLALLYRKCAVPQHPLQLSLREPALVGYQYREGCGRAHLQCATATTRSHLRISANRK